MYSKKVSLKPSQKFLGQVLLQDLGKNEFAQSINIKFDFVSMAIFWNGCCTGNGTNGKKPNKWHV